jgi:hypothetical protein
MNSIFPPTEHLQVLFPIKELIPFTLTCQVSCHVNGTVAGIQGVLVILQTLKDGMLLKGTASLFVATKQPCIFTLLLKVGLKKSGAPPWSHIISASLVMYSNSSIAT